MGVVEARARGGDGERAHEGIGDMGWSRCHAAHASDAAGLFSASGLCPGRRRRHGPSDAQLAASSADVCPEVWGMQLDAMYPEIRPNPETSRRIGSHPPSELVSKLASAGLDPNQFDTTNGGGPFCVNAGRLLCI